MAERKTPRVPLAAVVVGGLLAGAGLFGLFRGVGAEPLPPPPTDPASTLPVPPIPPVETTPLPPVQQAGGVLPPITPLPAPALPKPDPTVPAVPPVPGPSADPLPPLPTSKPVDPLPPAAVKPHLPPLPPEVPPSVDPLPALPKTDPVAPKPADPLPVLPKPAEVPQPVQPLSPDAPLPPIPPVKPENVLRPEVPPLTVIPGPPPVGSETLPPPRKVGNETFPPPRPVIEERVPPTPKPDGVVPIAAPFTPGSTPMTTAPRTALMTALVGAALASTPAFADDPKPGDPKTDAEAMKAVLKEIADLKADVKMLKEEKAKLEKALFGIGDSQRKTADEKGKLLLIEEAQKEAQKKAQDELDKMAAKVKDLEGQLAQKSVSAKQPVESTTPGKGMVKLVNEYNVKVSMIVNGTSYPLAVNEVKTIEVPEGKLKYELVEFPNAMTKETSIKEGETVTLRIK
jgi:hypothetical protein